MKLKSLPVFLAFLAMGFADALGPFVSLAKKEFQLSTAVATLIPFVGLSMYGLLSIPTGIFQKQHGKKLVLVMGLLICLLGMLNASFGLSSFPRFLFSVVLIGAGTTILQVAANPLMREVSAEGKSARNLVLGQFVKAIGSLSGPLIPVVAARFFGLPWTVAFPLYSIALLITILSATTMRVGRQEADSQAATLRSCFALLENRYLLTMTAAIFLYVGAEVSVSAGIPLFLKERFGTDITRVGLLGTGLFFTALIIGRFSGGLILNWVAAPKFLVLTCLFSLGGLLCLFLPSRTIATIGFFLCGLGFANIFPLVFSAAMEHMPGRANEISGLMVTAIVGGAILPPLMGIVADHSTVEIGFLVPMAAIVYVTIAALLNNRNERYAEAGT